MQSNYFYSVKMAVYCLKIIEYITQMHFLGRLAWVCCAVGSVLRIWPQSSVAICIDYQVFPVVRLYIVESTWPAGSDKNHSDKCAPDILILEV